MEMNLSAFGVKYTPQGVDDLLNRIGFSYKKPAGIPCKADACKQEEEESGTLLTPNSRLANSQTFSF